MACLRGFEPPTFGSGVQRPLLVNRCIIYDYENRHGEAVDFLSTWANINPAPDQGQTRGAYKSYRAILTGWHFEASSESQLRARMNFSARSKKAGRDKGYSP